MVCWSLRGKTPMIRSMVLEASMVCRVDKTRWPVSAASRAISIVSLSRISPTRITFGACRRAARRARAKVGVSLCSSRWWMVAFLWLWRNSTGSSNRQDVVGLLLVDLVQDGRQRGGFSCADRPGHQHDARAKLRDRRKLRGQTQSGEVGNGVGDDAHHDGAGAALAEDVD